VRFPVDVRRSPSQARLNTCYYYQDRYLSRLPPFTSPIVACVAGRGHYFLPAFYGSPQPRNARGFHQVKPKTPIDLCLSSRNVRQRRLMEFRVSY